MCTTEYVKLTTLSEQVCIRWHRAGVYYTAKLTFSHGPSIKVWVHIIQVCVLYSNFYGNIGELPKLCEKISILMQANILIADWYVAHSFPHS